MVSLTQPASAEWREHPEGFRRWEKSTRLGDGPEIWTWARTEVLRWGVKTRSGFTVSPEQAVRSGDRPAIVAHPFGLSVREPVEVVAVVDEDDRVGFAYRTLAGHPVSGEEAFIVHREGDAVILTVRSLTRPGRGHWRALYPVLLVAQSVARRRYLRALRLRATR
ncbi:DUF1990 family protein [Microbacterium sp. NPDC056569]|uniref:DUF1990 family protein n=1 Tax=Microbacterium sp. NPDC056569 TaxID=3345867 RepID=UPI00366F87EB